MSKHMYSTANLSDKELKEQGNRLFSLRRFEDAMNCYTKAIVVGNINGKNQGILSILEQSESEEGLFDNYDVNEDYYVKCLFPSSSSEEPLAEIPNACKIYQIKNPSVATYFTNRALCHLKMKRWEATCQDCRRALDIDTNQVKGHFFLGQALVELDCYDEAIKHLHRANDLAREQKLNFGDDIAAQIRIARKKRWNVQEEKRISQEIELQSYLNRLINEDMQRRIEALKLDNSNEEDITAKASKIEDECNNYSSELNSLFSKMDERRRKRDVPDYLCGKISFEILNEPVITPSGITYEKKDIEEHLERVGHFDPVTRVKLTADQLIPNFTMKEVVDAFLQDNEWALDY